MSCYSSNGATVSGRVDGSRHPTAHTYWFAGPDVAVERGQVRNHKQNVVSVDCPYCDGENVVAPVQHGRREVDLTDREIACKYCRSLFTLSESKPRIRRLSKQELDIA